MMSLSSEQAHSSVIANTIGEMSSSSDLNLDTVAKGFFNRNEESLKASYSSVQYTPTKQTISQVVSRQQAQDKLDKIKINRPELDEFTEIQFVNDKSKDTVVKHENGRRRSISDLVERYKKLLETSNSVTAKLESKCIEYEIE